jgi:hypothetical protein
VPGAKPLNVFDRSKARREYERVGTGAGVEDIVRSADQCCWAAAGSERLTAEVSIQHRRGTTDQSVVVQVLVETEFERAHPPSNGSV